MILYHGTNLSIDKINLNKCKPYKDFGKGFYLTTLKDQAEKMALRTARIFGETPTVNVYEYTETAQLNIKHFKSPDIEWAMFVINNTNESFSNTNFDNNFDNRYDVVIGPVANDDLALLFRQFANNMISVDYLIKEMKYKKLTDQYSFHTEDAINCLRKVDEFHAEI